MWTHCQVYDAPDPGEGWRLIDIDKDDFTDKSIEVWNEGNQCWEPRLPCNQGTVFDKYSTYRIRITPAVKYVPFTWEDREELRGRWIVDEYGNEYQFTRFELHATYGICFDGTGPVELLEKWKFLDTGEPVGKKVQA